jgi:hypothetical protein
VSAQAVVVESPPKYVLTNSSYQVYLYLDNQGGQGIFSYTPDPEDWTMADPYPNHALPENITKLREIWSTARLEWEETRSTLEKKLEIGIFDGMCTRSEPRLALLASSFEEFLVRMYHEFWVLRATFEARGSACVIPDHLKEYLVGVYSKPLTAREKEQCVMAA